MSEASDPFRTLKTFQANGAEHSFHSLPALAPSGLDVLRVPVSIRLVLESLLRNCDGKRVTEHAVRTLASWQAKAARTEEIPFVVARIVLQDFTGVPLLVDLAAMRSAVARVGKSPKVIEPLVPVDLVVDHSVQVDFSGSAEALAKNLDMEFTRNRERYQFLKWGMQAFDTFKVVPPGIGIVHQVNLEFLAKGILRDAAGVVYPDTLVGTDSHTTMINGLGIVGWGVGGIEAEAGMLGQPVYFLTPDVVGVHMTGSLREGVTATDLALTVTQLLRKAKVVGKFVEFYGPGVAELALADRATIANMAPEYGATIGFFPIDAETLRYLRLTGRTEAEVQLVERYYKEQRLFRTDDTPPPKFTKVLRLDMGTVEPSLAGPKRPQDRVALSAVKKSFQQSLRAPVNQRGFALDEQGVARHATVAANGHSAEIGHGAVVIAAITSCTNTSNPSVMVAAGLLAKAAVERGLHVKSYVKTSLAPGSRVVTDYLDAAGLTEPLEKLGFNTVGYGCTTCIGNSGPLPDNVAKAVDEGKLVAAAVLSGNRNFEGRINALVKANWLASPPLVVAYALAGSTDVDLSTEPLGKDRDGVDVYLRDIWPTQQLVAETVAAAVKPAMFRTRYGNVWDSNPQWNEIKTSEGDLFDWQPDSTYIQEPPFLIDLAPQPGPIEAIHGARVLAALGDSVTTDHISPAGSIAAKSPAGKFLQEHGVVPAEFNSYGSRRGNDRVMTRGTLANIRIHNLLAPGTEGGVTRHLPDGAVMPIYDAAMHYKEEKIPLVILAGEEYGTGSSRDWAAKGTMLLGVRAVLASSFERIHRSNLVGMGVLPLVLPQSWQQLGLTGEETFDIPLDDSLRPRSSVTVHATAPDGTVKEFQAKVRIDTPVELDYFRNGGILQTVLRKLLAT
jgi:aconitate hydratase